MSEFGHLMYMFCCCCCCCSATKSKTPIFLPKQLPPNVPQECQCQIAQTFHCGWSCWRQLHHAHLPIFIHIQSIFPFFPFSSSFWSNPIIAKQRNVVGLGLLNLFSISMKRTHKSLWNILFKKLLILKTNLKLLSCHQMQKDKRPYSKVLNPRLSRYFLDGCS